MITLVQSSVNVAKITLTVPPLRERREDIAPLVEIFLRQAGERFGKNLESVEPALLQRFINHDWPGNARELKSAIDQLALLYDGPVLREGWWEAPPPTGQPATPVKLPSAPPTLISPEALPRHENKSELAKRLLAESGNNLTLVAAQLGINPTTLWRWRKAGKL